MATPAALFGEVRRKEYILKSDGFVRGYIKPNQIKKQKDGNKYEQNY